MKENLEQTSEMQEEATAPTVAGEEEVVVDAVDSAPTLSNRDLDAPRDFVVGPQQLLGLDHAVLQSIDRCRMYIQLTHQMCNIYIIYNKL